MSQKLLRCLSLTSAAILLNTSVFSSMRAFMVRSSFFLPQFHHCPLISPRFLILFVSPGWLDDGFLSRNCCESWLVGSQLWHRTRVWLAILELLERILVFPSWLNPWFLQTEDYGETVTPMWCEGFCTRPWCQPLGHDTSARSIVMYVSPCRTPGCVGLAVDTGVKRTSLSASSSAHPSWLVPCRSHRLDRVLKSPNIMIVSPSSSSISSRKSQLAPVM